MIANIKRQFHKIKHVFRENVNKYVFNSETLGLYFQLKTFSQRLIAYVSSKLYVNFPLYIFHELFQSPAAANLNQNIDHAVPEYKNKKYKQHSKHS
jgi:hypothetical protein